MAKLLLNPMELKVEFDYDGADVTVKLSAHYGRNSEGISDRQGIPITLTTAQEASIKNFTKSVVIPQIKAQEGIS